MKALIKTKRAEGALSLTEHPLPVPGPDEVVLRVISASICGSDVHAYLNHPSYHWMQVPVVMGHEICGVVEQTGPGVTSWKIGEFVTVEAIQGCLECSSCRSGKTHNCEQLRVIGLSFDGGFAEFVKVKTAYLHRIPPTVDPATACLVEPFSVAYHGVARQTRLEPGDTALVLGPGPIGLFTALLARMHGASTVVAGTDADEATRLHVARELGFPTINVSRENVSSALARVFGEKKVTAVFECSGSPEALRTAIDSVVKGGQITLIGLFPDQAVMDIAPLVRREIRLHGSYGSNAQDFEKSIRILAEAPFDLNRLVTRYRLDEYEIAFERVIQKQDVKPVFQINTL